MCGRYALSKLPSELAEEFEIHTGESLKKLLTLPPLPADWNITPTRDIYIIRNSPANERDLAITSWGLIAPWSKTPADALKSQSQAINARSETVDQKPTFRSAFRARRCLIPADGYYEWATEHGDFPPKQPFYISADTSTFTKAADSTISSDSAHSLNSTNSLNSTHSSAPTSPSKKVRSTLALAGIWESWVSPDGKVRESAAIITRPAVDFLADIHSRMPTFLPEDRWDRWLDTSLRDVEEIRSLMQLDSPAAGLNAIPVSTAVNSIRNNGPQLIDEIDLDDHLTLF